MGDFGEVGVLKPIKENRTYACQRRRAVPRWVKRQTASPRRRYITQDYSLVLLLENRLKSTGSGQKNAALNAFGQLGSLLRSSLAQYQSNTIPDKINAVTIFSFVKFYPKIA